MSTGRIIGIVILVVGVLVVAFAMIQTFKEIQPTLEYKAELKKYYRDPWTYNRPYYEPEPIMRTLSEKYVIFMYVVGAALGITGVVIIKKTKTK